MKEVSKNINERKNRISIITFSIVIIILLFLVCSVTFIISKSYGNKLQEVTEATVVDVTRLVLGEETEHSHIMETKYDETNHWKECIACGKKENIVSHVYVDNGWTMGSSCSENNVHKYSCECGYSYTDIVGRPSHNMGVPINYTASFRKGYECLNRCGFGGTEHYCYKSDGSRISCSNLGICNICNFNYTTDNSYHIATVRNLEYEKEVRCQVCNQLLGTVNFCKTIKLTNNSYKCQGSVTMKGDNKFGNFGNYNFFGGKYTISDEKNNTSGNTWTFERTITFDGYREQGGYFQTNMDGKMSSGLTRIIMISDVGYLDSEVPVISNITVEEDSCGVLEWSQNKTIKVEGTENYCKSVKVKIVNENEETVVEGETSVTNQAYSISFTPNIEADEVGKPFKVVVTDSCENSTEQEFTISKVDRIAPKVISTNEILGDWAKTKEFTFEATDNGIGNVWVGFNDVADYKLAEKSENTYTREYKFVGDVYTPKEANVFYKDELGNLKTQKITIDKIDNTAPTITEARINKNKISITSNDIHEELGEGSGVAKYRYVTSENKVENIDITEYESIEVGVDEEIAISNINDKKYIYVVAEDKVGNVSEVYEIKIPELELTTNVNLLTENKKGEIILEWSTYNTENKIFKVYRKKEGQEEFENILTIDSKGEMIDNLAQDMKEPNIPTITATGIKEENKIKISYNTEDKGSTYAYYIEVYDKEDDSLLLKTSNEREEIVTTGVKGYYYIIDTNSDNTNFDINTGTYVEDENIKIELEDNGKYIHMKAVDVAGNISEGITLEIELKSKQTINLDGGNIEGEENIELEEGLAGETVDLGIPEKEGYTFGGWEATEGTIDGTKYTYGIENGEITAKWIKNSYEYKVEYYYNGVKDDNNTETKEAEYESQIEEYKEKIKEGYKFEKIENLPLKITTNVENNVIKVYYIPDESKTKEISYKVEYYKDNEKVEEDTQIENKTVQVLENIMDVDKTKINTLDKYRGYKLDRTEPENIPSKIENGGVIKIYYIRKVGNIEVKYIDEVTGEEIEEKETITGIEGDRYNTESKDISGYELVKEPTNKSGEMKEGTITVTYKYRKLSKVIVKYVDLNSGEEIEKVEKEYKEGENYTTESKEISGYKLVETSGKVNGTVGRKEIEVIYGYKKIAGGVIVKHIDKENNEVIKEEKISGLVGEKYNTKRLELQKYNFVEVVGNEEGELTEESIEIVYYYEKKQAIVEIIYEDEKGKEIYKEIIEGKVGEKYKVEIKDIENYKVIDIPESIEGTYTVEEIVVEIKVEKIKVKVIIDIVDEKGNIIEIIEREGYIRESEEINLPEISGYYTEEKSIVIEYGKENNINIVYKKMLFNIPNTSDRNIYLYIGIFVVSVIVICTVAIIMKKKK